MNASSGLSADSFSVSRGIARRHAAWPTRANASALYRQTFAMPTNSIVDAKKPSSVMTGLGHRLTRLSSCPKGHRLDSAKAGARKACSTHDGLLWCGGDLEAQSVKVPRER